MKIKNRLTVKIIVGVFCCFSCILSAAAQNNEKDRLLFGQKNSEQQHQFAGDDSKVIKGGLGQTARVMLPLNEVGYEGGKMAFRMKVDPDAQNYFTVKLWGSDRDKSMIMLFVNGKQVGYHHLGDIDYVFLGNGDPFFRDRFVYVTIPIPLKETRGKDQVDLELHSYGEVWPYGMTFDAFQKKMENPTLGVYTAYVHTSTYFEPPGGELQGKPQLDPPVRKQPGEEVIGQVESRVNGELKKIINAAQPANQQEMMFLAPAYQVKWTVAYQNPKVIKKVLEGVDNHYRIYLTNPSIIYSDKNIYNGDWIVTGPIAEAIRDLWTELSPLADQSFDDGQGHQITHRRAWSILMQEAIRYSTVHRRQYSNQSMIVDLFIYHCNEALRLLEPEQALPQAKTLHYLYEAVGLTPWLGSETPNGPSLSMGNNYWQLTQKGLTKELGFVGYYGEVLDWVNEIYLATGKPGVPNSGDPQIRAQLLKMARARSYFRYPEVDNDGYRAMRAETLIGWRDSDHYPGNVTYGDRAIAWDASPLMTASSTLDPEVIGVAQQMMNDNQLFSTITEKMKLPGLRATKSLLHIPDDYQLLKQQGPQTNKLPMTDGMPDFVFSDEEDGVLAVKHGQEKLYASLYWRAGNGINKLAKVHYITPGIDHVANIYIDSEFEPSGMVYITRNISNIRASTGRDFYKGIITAQAGDELPVARIPDGVAYKKGDENPYAGRASFYQMRYGKFLIGMNTTKDKTFQLKIPAGFGMATNLTTHQLTGKESTITVPAFTTIVLVANH